MQRILFFDGECNLCNGFVDFMLRHQTKVQQKFAPLQGHTAKSLIPALSQKMGSVVYLRDDKVYEDSEAAILAVADLGGIWSGISALLWLPRSLRDAIYRLVASRRYAWFGRRSCRIPTAEEQSHFLD